jgi:hypothetical protein
MDIKQLVDELTSKVKDPSFTELSAKFRTALKQARGYTSDEKREFYSQFKQLWDERKAWLENRKKEQEQKVAELDYLLDVIDRLVESTEYMEQAKIFEKDFQHIGYFAHDKKDILWARYEKVKEKRKVYLDEKRNVSGSIKEEYERELVDLDATFGGAPQLQEGSNWEKIGTMIKAVRDTLRDVRQKIESDENLMRPEKRLLYELIDSIRDKIREAEEETFAHHGKRAEELLAEAKRILLDGNFGKSVDALKSLQGQIRMLWLRKGEKEKHLASIEELWGQLKDKRKEKKQQFHDWLEKQRDGLDKLRAVKTKAEDALLRVQKNIEENRMRLSESRSEEFTEKIQNWIKEGEEKEADILKSLNDLNRKVKEIEDKLKKHGMMSQPEGEQAEGTETTEAAPEPPKEEEKPLQSQA